MFRSTYDRQVFLSLLESATRRTGAEVHAYCLMGNHYHLLIRTPNPTLDETIRLLAGPYARHFNDYHGKDGRLCRDRYHALLIDSEHYLLAVSRYIHRNPTAFGIAALADYTWSSYPAYLGIRPPQDWLQLEETLQMAGGRSQLEALVESCLLTETDKLYERNRLPVVLGSKAFAAAARQASRLTIEKGAWPLNPVRGLAPEGAS
ncbi:MAG: putative transposase [Verrucomicrobiales bacterium]|jgi:putative transposase